MIVLKVKLDGRTSLITICQNDCKFNDHFYLQEATNLVSELIAKTKKDYHNNLALRVNNPATSAKTYW